MKFLRNFFAALLALVVFSLVGFILFFAVVAVVGAKDELTVNDNSVLHLKLNKPIREIEGEEDPLAELPMFAGDNNAIGVIDLRRTLRKAAEDDKIKGVFLDAPYVIAGLGNMHEIRNELKKFKESGKFIVSYANFYTEGGYYLSSVSDEVFLNTEGDVEFNGLSANITFYKGTFEKLGIEPEIFRVGDFKSAVEPYTRKDMSDANRLQLTSVLESVQGYMLENISESRNIPVAKLKEISDQMLVRNTESALDYGLVDQAVYYDQFLDHIAERVGVESTKDIDFVSYGDYRSKSDGYTKSENKVAVIVAYGDIVRGEGKQNQSIGGKKFAKEIRKARLDDKVKAIVVRINSPGGDFVASDMMWREIELASHAKPVIASMADYAASGGYYMAMACDTIVAQPTTITGSIGIYGMLFNAQDFMREKLGLTHDVAKTGEFSDMMTITRPLTEAEKAIIQQGVNEGYETFTSKAAEGRGMKKEDLLKIASGRVWTGEQAFDNGLVDVLGGLEEAIAIAAEKADIADDYKLRYYPKYKPLMERIFDNKGADVKSQLIEEELGDMYFYLKEIKKIRQYQGIQARMPYDISIQ